MRPSTFFSATLKTLGIIEIVVRAMTSSDGKLRSAVADSRWVNAFHTPMPPFDRSRRSLNPGRENGRNLRRTGIIPENQRFGKGRTSGGIPTRTRRRTAGFAGNSKNLTFFAVREMPQKMKASHHAFASSP
jgi:hypothetical protein